MEFSKFKKFGWIYSKTISNVDEKDWKSPRKKPRNNIRIRIDIADIQNFTLSICLDLKNGRANNKI